MEAVYLPQESRFRGLDHALALNEGSLNNGSKRCWPVISVAVPFIVRNAWLRREPSMDATVRARVVRGWPSRRLDASIETV